MTEPELRHTFRSAATEVIAEVKPPGIETLRTRLHRRRRRRAVTGILAACAVATAILVPTWIGSEPMAGAAPSTATHRPDAPSPSVPTTPTPSASRPTTLPPSPSAHSTSTRANAPTSTHSTGHPSPKPSTCRSRNFGEINYPGGRIELNANVNSYYHLCPGDTLRMFWAQYLLRPDGSQQLLTAHVVTLTPAHPDNLSDFPDIPAGKCRGDFITVVGNYTVVQGFKAGVDPYPSFLDYQGGEVEHASGVPCP